MVKLLAPLVAALATTASTSLSSAHTIPKQLESQAESQVLKDPYPYHFPLQNSTGENLFPVPKCHGINLEEITIDRLQHLMAKGRLTSLQLAMCYVKRIYQIDDYVNAIMELNPDFTEIAAELDEERSRGHVRGPLHGIPFLVKDNIGTKDKMETTAGSWSLLGSVLPRDSFVVKQLRDAGALILGKSTLSEWADMRSNYYSEGYSARGGQARSAYNLSINPGGSSSGSGIAVGANMIPFALGTETDGSIVSPASRNAVVGIKPTVGLTSRAGVIPECHRQDTVGPHARTMRDAVYVLDAIYGVDQHDNYTEAQIGKTPAGGYSQFLADKSALKGATFGIPWESFWTLADDDMQSKLVELVELIREAGATVVNGTEIPTRDLVINRNGWDWDFGATRGYPNESEYTIVKVDFYNDIRKYLGELNNTDIKSLEDIVKYNYDNDGTEGGNPNVHPAFQSGQDGFLASMATQGIMNETYWQAVEFCKRATGEDGIDAALRNAGGKPLDLLLVPIDVAQAPQISAQAGYPVISLPAGVRSENGMPFGLGLMGTAWSEPSLIKYASAIEDLQASVETKLRRTLPLWYDYKARVLPVISI